MQRVTIAENVALSAHEIAAGRHFFGERFELAVRYARELCDSGVAHGLVGPREVPRMWTRHVLNCAALIEAAEDGSDVASVVDVGSGAGLPGMVLALARPAWQVTLIEPLQRRVAWLKNTASSLGVDVDVKRGRAEEFHGDVTADVVTARAVAHVGKLVDWCAPLVASNGRMVFLKGASVGEELQAHRKKLMTSGFGCTEIVCCGGEFLDQPSTCLVLQR